MACGFEKVNPIGTGRIQNTTSTFVPSQQNSKRICRNLFGSPEPGEIQDLLRKEQNKNEEKLSNYVDITSICDKTDNSSTKRKNSASILTDYYQKRKYMPNAVRAGVETFSQNNANNCASSSAVTALRTNSVSAVDSKEFLETDHQKTKKSQE